MQAFQMTAMSKSVAEPTLRHLAGELLCRLLDERVPRLEEGTALLKALNILMLKILENSKRNYAFSCLLHLLRVPPVGAVVRPPSPLHRHIGLVNF